MEPDKGWTPEMPHHGILSRLLAQMAARAESVVTYRSEVLKGQMLSLAEVGPWIEARRNEDGPPTLRVTFSAPDDPGYVTDSQGALWLKRPVQTLTGCTFDELILLYCVPEDRLVHRVATREGGVLDRLRLIAEELREGFDWHPAQATLFVLTGYVPWVRRLYTETRMEGLRAKIRFDIDPSAPPQWVLQNYKEARRQWHARWRPLSEKHSALAWEMATWSLGKPWTERLSEWNERYPKWRYQQESNFRRDAAKARSRVLFLPTVDMDAIQKVTTT
jgi:hypothetical protein